MRKLTPLFWLQSTVLVAPLSFLLTGGCGGGGSNSNPNGGFFGSPSSPPTVITNPTAVPPANATPTPTPTAGPTPTPTPIVLTNFSPELSFSLGQAVPTPTSLRLFLSNATERTLSIGVPRNRDFTFGQTFPALTSTLAAEAPNANQAGVTYVEGSKTWHADSVGGRNGTVVISNFRTGPIPSPDPSKIQEGILIFQLSEVLMKPDPATNATGLLIITGPFRANSGGVFNIDPTSKIAPITITRKP